MLRTINNMIRTLLFQASATLEYWVEALHTAAHLLNILPSTAINNDAPHTRLFKTQPTYQHLKTFGCLCYPNLISTAKHKLAQRSTPCAFLGYPQDHRGYRCLGLKTKQIILSRHVVFDEMVFPFSFPSTHSTACSTPLITPSPIIRPTTTPTAPPPSPPPSPHILSPQPPTPKIDPTPPAPAPAPQNTHSMVTRGKSGIIKPRLPMCLHTDNSISLLPISHVQAAKDPVWNCSMNLEHDAHIKKGTWVLVPRPKDTNIVRSM